MLSLKFRNIGPQLLCTLLVFCFLALGGSARARRRLTVQDLPPFDQEATFPQYERQQAELKQKLGVYLRGQFTIKEERYFQRELIINWDASRHSFHDIFLALGYRPKRVRFEWEAPGYDIVEIYRLGRFSREYVALSMLNEPVDGKWLLGYFILEK